MQTKDFKGQDLRGKSFKNQDLTGADFSDCDLRGVDFSFSDLTDAKFCNARMGRTKEFSFYLWLFRLLLAVFAGFVAAFCSFFVFYFSTIFLKIFDLNTEINLVIFVAICFALCVKALLESILQQNIKYLIWFCGLFIITAKSSAVISVVRDENLAVILTLAGFIVEVVILTFAVSSSGVTAGVVASIIVVSEIKAAPETTSEIAGVVAVIICTMLGIYLAYRANKKEEPQLLLLRNWSLKIHCWCGTEFAFANLNQVDFTNTDLKYTRFKNAKFNKCNFQNTKNHHLALFENTPLEPRKVRDLVIDGIITDKNWLFPTSSGK